MTTPQHSCPLRPGPPGPATDALVAWRVRTLIDAGFEPDLAATLSRRGGTDLHALLTLVDRGCPAPLAARILDPAELHDE